MGKARRVKTLGPEGAATSSAFREEVPELPAYHGSLENIAKPSPAFESEIIGRTTSNFHQSSEPAFGQMQQQQYTKRKFDDGKAKTENSDNAFGKLNQYNFEENSMPRMPPFDNKMNGEARAPGLIAEPSALHQANAHSKSATTENHVVSQNTEESASLNEGEILMKLPKDYLAVSQYIEKEFSVNYGARTLGSKSNSIGDISGENEKRILKSTPKNKVGSEPVERSRNSLFKRSNSANLNSPSTTVVQEVEDEKRNDITNNKNLSEEEEEEEEEKDEEENEKANDGLSKKGVMEGQGSSASKKIEFTPAAENKAAASLKKQEVAASSTVPGMINPPPQLQQGLPGAQLMNEKQVPSSQTVFSKVPASGDSSENRQGALQSGGKGNASDFQKKSTLSEQFKNDKAEFQRLTEMLKKGKSVKKYGRKSLLGPEKRVLFMTADYVCIALGKSSSSKTTKSFEIGKIKDLKKGKETQNFQKYKKAKEELCMSIIYTDRSIDIEATTEQELKELYEGLGKLVELQKKYVFSPEFNLK